MPTKTLDEKQEEHEWRCSACSLKLGIISVDKTSVRIKYKDLYITIEGGRIQFLCRRCATVNILEDPDFRKYKQGQKGHGG
jgi:hypothetical protein